MSSSIDVEIINQFFADEVANVRLSTDNARHQDLLTPQPD